MKAAETLWLQAKKLPLAVTPRADLVRNYWDRTSKIASWLCQGQDSDARDKVIYLVSPKVWTPPDSSAASKTIAWSMWYVGFLVI